jgi:hypothetical protein
MRCIRRIEVVAVVFSKTSVDIYSKNGSFGIIHLSNPFGEIGQEMVDIGAS